MELHEVDYTTMIPFGEDFNVILHSPHDNLRYFALKDGKDICAVCEVWYYKNRIKIDCLFVPEDKRGHGYAYDLLMHILFENQGKYASAQANDWSIKTFLKAGFKVSSTRKCKYWTAYFVHKEVSRA